MEIVIFDDSTPEDQVRATIFELLGRDALLAAVERDSSRNGNLRTLSRRDESRRCFETPPLAGH